MAKSQPTFLPITSRVFDKAIIVSYGNDGHQICAEMDNSPGEPPNKHKGDRQSNT